MYVSKDRPITSIKQRFKPETLAKIEKSVLKPLIILREGRVDPIVIVQSDCNDIKHYTDIRSIYQSLYDVKRSRRVRPVDNLSSTSHSQQSLNPAAAQVIPTKSATQANQPSSNETKIQNIPVTRICSDIQKPNEDSCEATIKVEKIHDFASKKFPDVVTSLLSGNLEDEVDITGSPSNEMVVDFDFIEQGNLLMVNKEKEQLIVNVSTMQIPSSEIESSLEKHSNITDTHQTNQIIQNEHSQESNDILNPPEEDNTQTIKFYENKIKESRDLNERRELRAALRAIKEKVKHLPAS